MKLFSYKTVTLLLFVITNNIDGKITILVSGFSNIPSIFWIMLKLIKFDNAVLISVSDGFFVYAPTSINVFIISATVTTVSTFKFMFSLYSSNFSLNP